MISTYCPPSWTAVSASTRPISTAAIRGAGDAAEPARQGDHHAFDERRRAGVRADEIVLGQQHRSEAGEAARHHQHRDGGRAQPHADEGCAFGVLHHGPDLEATAAGLHPGEDDKEQHGRAHDGADLVIARHHGADLEGADAEDLGQRFDPGPEHPEQALGADEADGQGRDQAAERVVRLVVERNEGEPADQGAEQHAGEDPAGQYRRAVGGEILRHHPGPVARHREGRPMRHVDHAEARPDDRDADRQQTVDRGQRHRGQRHIVEVHGSCPAGRLRCFSARARR